MKPRSLRSRLTAALALGTFLALGILVVGFNLLLRSSLDSGADRALQSAAQSELETIQVVDGNRLRLLEGAEAPSGTEIAGSEIWVYDETDALEQPAGLADLQPIAESLIGTDQSFAEASASDTRLYSMAVAGNDGSQVGTVIAALSLDPYERTAESALTASLLFATLVLLGMVGAGRFLIGRALLPVSRMTSSAKEWSETDLAHRFGDDEPYDELTELGAAFDAMFERLASSLRHEQRFSAEISHELRTPLAVIIAESELALGHDAEAPELHAALARIDERARQLNRILEALLAAARAEVGSGHAGSIVEDAVAQCIENLPASARAGAIEFRLDPEGAHPVDAAADLLERMIAPLIENAARYARSSVEVTVRNDAQQVLIAVHDDGPGVAEEELELIFEPGRRGKADAQDDADAGAGLGLALCRRLARAAGGDARTLAGSSGGATFELSLPAVSGPSAAISPQRN